MKALTVAAALLAGCAVQIPVGADFAAAYGLAMFGVVVVSGERDRGLGYARTPPEMDPTRKVNEQDCTKPIDWSAGNIRCK